MPSHPRRQTSWNPLAFVPAQVTFFASAIYLAVGAAVLWTHLHVPPAPPASATPAPGVNLTAAWRDLAFLSDGFHPWHSRRNGEVRDYLQRRIEAILSANGVAYKVVDQRAGEADVVRVVSAAKSGAAAEEAEEAPRFVTVFRDDRSNATHLDDFRRQPWTCYGESENLLVYIRGESDAESGDWWRAGEPPYRGPGGVLVNAHFDSVASGYGATDDGVGVVSVLQLISHFTADGHRPKRGIVALLNDGEEEALYGAYNYVRHPLAQFPHTFLNLEGAGAGGRATLFRSTDAEVTEFYSRSPLPFGSVVSGDGFKLGLIGSGTDYSVFVDTLGMRGLDVAFFEPRARYHTDQDDLRDTTPASLWHMLSGALSTMRQMTSYGGDEFEGGSDASGKFKLRSGSYGVWFDVFGRAFAVLRLHTLFALSVTLLVVGPVLLIALEVIITRSGRWYPLSRRQYPRSGDDDKPIHFSGLRGLFRFPIAFVIATAAVFALAYLLAKINPYIAYSSEYAVWAMMLCAWFAVAWFFFAGADRVRPTALHRMYCLLWLYALTWAAVVVVTIGEKNLNLGSGYFLVIYHASIFVATLISYLELFALPTKTAFVEHMAAASGDDGDYRSARRGSRSSRRPRSLGERRGQGSVTGGDDDDANEATSLLGGSSSQRGGGGGTFTGIAKRRQAGDDEMAEASDDPLVNRAYGDEQAWSSSLPKWLWLLQFLIIGPINIVLVGQIGLLVTSALHMTSADGSPVLNLYLIIAALTVLLLLPLTPFLHRLKYQVPTLLFAIFIGCLVYTLLAFPFSRDARMKFYMVQRLDLDSGNNTVSVRGLDGYVQDIISALPSAMGQDLTCGFSSGAVIKADMTTCSWHGLGPHLTTDSAALGHSSEEDYSSWLQYNISHHNNTAQFSFQGRETKACRLVFDQPVVDVVIEDAAADSRFDTVASNGSAEVRLFGRSWDKTFHVNVSWPVGVSAKGQTGRVLCLWADGNQPNAVPAFTEALRFAPVWSVPAQDGETLVEGFKKFKI